MKKIIFTLACAVLPSFSQAAEPTKETSIALSGYINVIHKDGAKDEFKEIKFENKLGDAVFEGDIILGTVQELLDGVIEIDLTEDASGKISSDNQVKGVYRTNESRWSGGVVPYTIDPDYSASENSRILQAMQNIEDNARITFIPRAGQSSYIYITDDNAEEDGLGICASHVGRKGGRQNLRLGPNCVNTRTVTHELLHALGVWHEQSRADRNQFITINWANILSGKSHNFNQHILDGEDASGGYDFKSIMHYSTHAFSSNGQATIVANDSSVTSLGGSSLSTLDISTLQELYGTLFVQPYVSDHSYEYASCSRYTRNGILGWENKGSGSTYKLERKYGSSWYEEYQGARSMIGYPSNTTGITADLRVRATQSGQNGSWYYFSIAIPSCYGGGGVIPR